MSDRIKEALDKMRDAETVAGEANARKAEADAIVAKARAENQSLIDEARAERERLQTQTEPNNLSRPDLAKKVKALSTLIRTLEGPPQALGRKPGERTNLSVVPAKKQ